MDAKYLTYPAEQFSKTAKSDCPVKIKDFKRINDPYKVEIISVLIFFYVFQAKCIFYV